MGDTLFGFQRSNVVLAAGLAGAAFLGYCVYFDHKRINAPDYKDKIRQKRRAQAGRGSGRSAAGPVIVPGGGGLPSGAELNDPSYMQRFFLQEVQLGEELMAAGNVEEGAIHIANAVALCGEAQQLLAIFQQTLSEEQFQAVVHQLPQTRTRLANLFGQKAEEVEDEPPMIQYIGDGPPPAQIQELIDDTDDLE